MSKSEMRKPKLEATPNAETRRVHALIAVAVLLLSLGTPAAFAKADLSSPKEQTSKLIAVLKSGGSRKEKADACRELARIGTKEAVPALAALLGDEQLSHMARYGLETIPGHSVDTAFRDALGTVRGVELVGVIGSIGVRRDTKAVPALAKFLEDPDPDVAQAGARALGSIGNSAAAKALREAWPGVSPRNQVAFAEGLLRCAETLAGNHQRKEAITIYDMLRWAQAPAQVRLSALRGAILTRPKSEGLALLLQAIGDTDPAGQATLPSSQCATFAAALRASQELPGSDVTRALAAEVHNLSAGGQVLLIETLAKRADPAALPALCMAARASGKPARLAALRALPEIGDASALDFLTGLVVDIDADIARAAQESLAALPGREVDGAILAMLGSSDNARCLVAIDLVARRRMATALPALLALAAGPDAKVRASAIRRAGDLGDATDIPALLALLLAAQRSEDLEATETALTALCGKAAAPDACAAQVTARLAQASPQQKCALLRVLGSIGGASALKSVDGAVKDPNADVHSAAIRILGNWATPDAAPALLALAESGGNATDKAICLRGYLRLAGEPEESAERRLDLCRRVASLVQNDDDKKLLLAALGGIYTQGSLGLITPYLDDPGVKQEAATATITIAEKLLRGKGANKAAPKLIEPLEKVVRNAPDGDLAKRAKELLDEARAKTKPVSSPAGR